MPPKKQGFINQEAVNQSNESYRMYVYGKYPKFVRTSATKVLAAKAIRAARVSDKIGN